jgi:perosamine synthetase
MLAQLNRLPDLIKARQAVADGYAERLAGAELITLPVTAPDRVHVWQSYVLTLDRSVNRGAVAQQLRSAGVQCTFGTYASHVQPLYGAGPACPVSADLFGRHLAIPMHANLTTDQVDRVADAVLAAVTEHAH